MSVLAPNTAPEFVVVPLEAEPTPLPAPMTLDDFCTILARERSKELAALRDEHALMTRVLAQITRFRSLPPPH